MDGVLRLGLYYHIPVMGRDGKICLPGFFGRFVDSLAEQCQRLTCFFHTASAADAALCDYPLTASNVDWVDLGPARSAPYRSLFAGRFTRLIVPHLPKLDALLLRGPSPLLPPIADAAVGRTPVVLLLVGDYLAGVDSTTAQPALRRMLIRLWAWWNTRGQLQAMRRSLTLVNSRKLYDDLRPIAPHLFEVHTTTLSDDDFFERVDTCQSTTVRLLYVGRLSAAKGLFDIVTAMSKLTHIDLHLDLVGWPEKSEPDIVAWLMAFAAERGLAGCVHHLGYKPLGPVLFDCYRAADIFVLASTSDFEGFPRAIWEAMANSLPVAASRVGSIAHYAEGAAELFAPADPDGLAAALERLISQPALRREHIRNGLALAHQNTLTAQTEKLVGYIQQWVRK
jgi:glycosyltransferase involved in cell wall biosynthesis